MLQKCLPHPLFCLDAVRKWVCMLEIWWAFSRTFSYPSFIYRLVFLRHRMYVCFPDPLWFASQKIDKQVGHICRFWLSKLPTIPTLWCDVMHSTLHSERCVRRHRLDGSRKQLEGGTFMDHPFCFPASFIIILHG